MSERSNRISRLLKSRASREAYIAAKLKVLIPSQIRALRLKSQTPRQEDLANAAEMKQSRISAMESPGAVNFNLETLVRVASALKVGLEVKFASFSDMLEWENDFSQDDFDAVRIDDDARFIMGVLKGSAQVVTATEEHSIIGGQARQEADIVFRGVGSSHACDETPDRMPLNALSDWHQAPKENRIIVTGPQTKPNVAAIIMEASSGAESPTGVKGFYKPTGFSIPQQAPQQGRGYPAAS